MNEATLRLGHVVLPVADIGRAVDFCEQALGLPLRFRDGDRYAALDGDSATLALAAAPEQVVAGAVSVGLKVEDLDAAAERARNGGATILGEIVETPHDRRLALADPDGNILVLYESRRPAAA
jgi:predicted enzyme related to lactoylglutathione lyase